MSRNSHAHAEANGNLLPFRPTVEEPDSEPSGKFWEDREVIDW